MKVKQMSSTYTRIGFSTSEKPILDHIVDKLDEMGGMNFHVEVKERPKYPDYFLFLEIPIIVDILTWATEFEEDNDMESIR
jgi:hypothetical protein